jgi:transcription elongation factor GreA
MTTRYISQENLEKFKTELSELKTVRRKEITKRIEEAKALGDLSENAEYLEAREAQAFNELRIHELEELIRNCVVIENEKDKKANFKSKSVDIGSTVEVQNAGGQRILYTIVGPDGADPSQNKISNESPLGRAFLQRIPGEEVEVLTPSGKQRFKVISIK